MKLLDWIESKETKEIFFAYQSVSDSAVLGAICEAIKERNIKVTFVMSRQRGPREGGGFDPLLDVSKKPVVETENSQVRFDRVMKRLTGCGLTDEMQRPVGYLRGHSGKKESDSLGWAHNKFFMINPSDPVKMHFASGSGNLTTGAVSSNHENWLFFENIPTQTYLAQSTLCVMKSQLMDRAQFSLSSYVKHNGECLNKIPKSYKKAMGIRTYYIPGSGDLAIKETLIPALSSSKKITMAAHLFGYPALFVRGLSCAASKKPNSFCFKRKGRVPGFKKGIGNSRVRMITDDDIHWLRVGQIGENGKVGFNSPWEANNVERVDRAGANIRYIQTAHQEKFIQIHHSKIILFEDGPMEGVWTGAGNFTVNALHTNFENYFYITIPSVVEAYKQQLDQMWQETATPYRDMPKIDTMPLSPDDLLEELAEGDSV